MDGGFYKKSNAKTKNTIIRIEYFLNIQIRVLDTAEEWNKDTLLENTQTKTRRENKVKKVKVNNTNNATNRISRVVGQYKLFFHECFSVPKREPI